MVELHRRAIAEAAATDATAAAATAPPTAAIEGVSMGQPESRNLHLTVGSP